MHLLNIILFLFYAFFVDLGIIYSMFTFNFDLYFPSIDNGNIYYNFYLILFSSSYIAIKQGLEFHIIGYKFMRYNLCIFILDGHYFIKYTILKYLKKLTIWISIANLQSISSLVKYQNFQCHFHSSTYLRTIAYVVK